MQMMVCVQPRARRWEKDYVIAIDLAGASYGRSVLLHILDSRAAPGFSLSFPPLLSALPSYLSCSLRLAGRFFPALGGRLFV